MRLGSKGQANICRIDVDLPLVRAAQARSARVQARGGDRDNRSAREEATYVRKCLERRKLM